MAKKPSVPVPGVDPAPRAQGATPTAAPQPVEPTAAPQPVAPAAPVSGVASVAPVGGVAPLSGAPQVGASGRVHELAARLRRGDLTPEQAIATLIEDTVQQHFGPRPSGAPEPPMSAALRAALQAHLEGDPLLRERVQRLFAARPPRREKT